MSINKVKRKPQPSPLSNLFDLRQEIALQKLRQGGTIPRVKSDYKPRHKEEHVH